MEWCFNCQQNVPVRTKKWKSADGKYVYVQRTCSRCNMILSTTRQKTMCSHKTPKGR